MKEAMLYEKLDNFAVHCYLCAHQCVIQNKHLGYCRVRKNIDGKLFSLNYGKLIAENVDPVEKKPLYHFFPEPNHILLLQLVVISGVDFVRTGRFLRFQKQINSVTGVRM